MMLFCRRRRYVIFPKTPPANHKDGHNAMPYDPTIILAP